MLGYKSRDQMELFITGSLRQLVPEDHVLVRVDRVLDLGWLREEVADCYCADNGRPGIDPEVAVRLMLAGLLLGIVHDRKLMREAQVKVSRTDADASMAPASRNRRFEPSYKQHTAVDDERGVVLDVAVTTGEVNDGDMIEAQVDAVQEIAGRGITTVTGDAGYAYGKVYAGLEGRGVDPVIPAKRERRSRMPLRRFRYDARHDT